MAKAKSTTARAVARAKATGKKAAKAAKKVAASAARVPGQAAAAVKKAADTVTGRAKKRKRAKVAAAGSERWPSPQPRASGQPLASGSAEPGALSQATCPCKTGRDAGVSSAIAYYAGAFVPTQRPLHPSSVPSTAAWSRPASPGRSRSLPACANG